MTRRPIQVVVAGLETTSDRIRALLLEGYLRTEVAEALDIRYQHVRKVAVDAGIEGGLQREGYTTSPRSKPKRKVAEETAIDVLVDAGFERLGTWVASETGIVLSDPAPRVSGVYAFVVDGMVKYIGVSKAGLHKRMDNYRIGNPSQGTSSRINTVIAGLVGEGSIVEIYHASPPPLEWNGLPVNAVAGLEEGLIEMIQPPWNKKGVR